jgi:DNA-binding FrmR family transcriptional regulator
MSQNKDKVLIAMKKAKTSLEKVMKMIEEDKYCIDVIQQNLAVIGLLKAANSRLLEGHVDCCIKTACSKGDKKDIENKMTELINVIKIAQSK